MPYTRAYRIPSPFAADDQLTATPLEAGAQLTTEETPTRLRPMLNITPSSNWIQETFYARDIVSEEVEESGEITTIEFLPIEKTKRPSLYQKFSDLWIRAKLFRVTSIASNPVPNEDTLKRFIEQANGDDVELDKIKKNWEMEIIRAVDNGDVGDAINKITEETVYLQAEFFRILGLESIRLTISSPELPTRGDQPVTAIYYSPFGGDREDGVGVIDGGVRDGFGQIGAIAKEPILFTWTDRSGFLSTMVILPNTIYEIQPVSIELGYEITLLA
jgi:hypothetical protein